MSNSVLDVINNRTSLRVHDNREISQEILDKILHAAMRAPTAGNQMIYSILVVRDEQTRKLLSQSCDHQAFIATAPVILIFLADHQRWFDYYQLNGVAEYCDREGLQFEAPQESDLLLAIEDAMAAAQNAVIAAESLGIGSCYIGDIVENYEFHKELFDLPDWAFPIGMLCLGYYRENHLKSRVSALTSSISSLKKNINTSLQKSISRCLHSGNRHSMKIIHIMPIILRRHFMQEKPVHPSVRKWHVRCELR